MVKAMVGGCCVCSDERGWDENPLVYCDGHGCDVAVHQACYGIVQVPKGPWFCRKCESQERIARVKCELCPSKVGALKRTDNGGWAHVVCALYIPEVRFGNVSTMEPIKLASVLHERYLKTCYICEERGKESKTAHGCCMNCNKLGCKQTFHVTCAQSCRLLCEENDGQSGPTVKYVGYCQYHWTKKTKGILFTKTPEKEKPKILPIDIKNIKKPKSRTSSESSTTSPNMPPNIKPDIVSTPVAKAPDTPAATAETPTAVKPRGRKPATVKTPPVSSNNSSRPLELSDSAFTSQTVLPAMAADTSKATQETMMIVDSVVTPIVTTMASASQVLSPAGMSSPVTIHSVAQPTPTPPPVSVPTPKTNTQPTKPVTVPKKRPSNKTSDEPKRKVGRPPAKVKSPTKPRLSNKQSGSSNKQSGQSNRQSGPSNRQSGPSNRQSGPSNKQSGRPRMPKVKSLLNTALPISTPSPLPTSPAYSNYSTGGTAAAVQSSPVHIQSGLVPHNTYVTPQPRHGGLLESGHQVPEQQNKQQTNNVPLQLPGSLEQLLEYQWEQGAQFLMQQASQYDVASLMSSLHQLKADNSRLEARLEALMARRSQLLQVNARLSAPMSCTPVSASTTLTDSTSNSKDVWRGRSGTVVSSLQGGSITSVTASHASMTTKDNCYTSGRTVSSVAMVEPTVCISVPSDTPQRSQNGLSQSQGKTVMSTGGAKPKVEKIKSPPAKLTASVQSVMVTPMITEQTHPMSSMSQMGTVAAVPKSDLSTSLTSDRHRMVVTAAPITVLPATQVRIAASAHPGSVVLPKQQKQPAQIMPAKHTNSKQPLILPQQPITSQSYSVSQLQQQQMQQQQFVLLMQQQQQLQQQQLHMQQEDHLRRQGATSRQDQPGPKDIGSTQAQSKGASAVISQQFVPTALGYPGAAFVTFSEQLGLSAGQSLPKGAAVFSTLPVMQIDNLSKVDYGNKNGMAGNMEKSFNKGK